MTSTTGRIAVITPSEGVAVQSLLAEIVAEWRAGGVRIVGVIGEAHGLPDRTCGAGYLRDIGSGKPHSIYLDVAPSHTSCHLDAAGVAGAATAIVDQVAVSDLVVLNKFGKLEAMAKGLAPAFRRAVAVNKPLLTTVSEKHRDAWHAFAPDAIRLAADKITLRNWWRAMQERGDHQTEIADTAIDYGVSSFR